MSRVLMSIRMKFMPLIYSDKTIVNTPVLDVILTDVAVDAAILQSEGSHFGIWNMAYCRLTSQTVIWVGFSARWILVL